MVVALTAVVRALSPQKLELATGLTIAAPVMVAMAAIATLPIHST